MKKVLGFIGVLTLLFAFTVTVGAVNNPMVGQSIKGTPTAINIEQSQDRCNGRHIDVVEHWIFFGNSFSGIKPLLDAAYENGTLFEVTLAPSDGGLDKINSGEWDTYLHQLAIDMKNWSHELWLRPMHEWNGNWYIWSVGMNGNTADEYISAWRRLVDIFRAEGAVNVKFDFNVASPNFNGNTFINAYPGDNYVDYCGVDTYCNSNYGWQTFDQVTSPAYNALKAKNKPIIISELGCTEPGGNKAAWITDAFNTVRNSGKYDLIKAMIWFDSTGYNPEYYIDTSTASRTAYNAAINYTSAAGGVNFAYKMPVTASSTNPSFPMANIVDGNTASRWSCDWGSNTQWIYVDLGNVRSINNVKLNWYTAYASGYSIETSTNAGTWNTVYSTTTGDGGMDDISFTATNARYVRIYCTVRGTASMYGLWEVEVYGGAVPPPTGTNIALGMTATASATQSGYPASYAVDGNTATRWSCYGGSDTQWIYVDLGSNKTVSAVKLLWNNAFASGYSVQTSTDTSAWNTVYSTTTGDGGIDCISFPAATARYVRVYCTVRGTSSYYSLFEYQIY